MATVQNRTCFAGAKGPQRVRFTVAAEAFPDGYLQDCRAVTGATWDVFGPDDAPVASWATTIVSVTADLIVFEHVLDAQGAEVARAGAYAVYPQVVTPQGVFPAGVDTITVLARGVGAVRVAPYPGVVELGDPPPAAFTPLAAPTQTAPAVVTGLVGVGRVATRTRGTYAGNPAPALDAGSWTLDGADITGPAETGATYLGRDGDAGHALEWRESATSVAGTLATVSNALVYTPDQFRGANLGVDNRALVDGPLATVTDYVGGRVLTAGGVAVTGIAQTQPIGCPVSGSQGEYPALEIDAGRQQYLQDQGAGAAAAIEFMLNPGWDLVLMGQARDKAGIYVGNGQNAGTNSNEFAVFWDGIGTLTVQQTTKPGAFVFSQAVAGFLRPFDAFLLCVTHSTSRTVTIKLFRGKRHDADTGPLATTITLSYSTSTVFDQTAPPHGLTIGTRGDLLADASGGVHASLVLHLLILGTLGADTLDDLADLQAWWLATRQVAAVPPAATAFHPDPVDHGGGQYWEADGNFDDALHNYQNGDDAEGSAIATAMRAVLVALGRNPAAPFTWIGSGDSRMEGTFGVHLIAGHELKIGGNDLRSRIDFWLRALGLLPTSIGIKLDTIDPSLAATVAPRLHDGHSGCVVRTTNTSLGLSRRSPDTISDDLKFGRGLPGNADVMVQKVKVNDLGVPQYEYDVAYEEFLRWLDFADNGFAATNKRNGIVVVMEPNRLSSTDQHKHRAYNRETFAFVRRFRRLRPSSPIVVVTTDPLTYNANP